MASSCHKLLPIRLLLAVLVLGCVPMTAALGDEKMGSGGVITRGRGDICTEETRFYEQARKIPNHLLTALSYVESGRWDVGRGEKIAWPWTVMAEGRGRYFPTKQGAVRAVRALQARGIDNIDIGCMQINLKHHPHAFKSIEDGFDPGRNVAYAAGFLTSLRRESSSWMAAAGRYHSSDPGHVRKYQRKLVRALRDLGTNNQRPPTWTFFRAVNAMALARVRGRQAERARKFEEAKRFANQWRAKKREKYYTKRGAP